MAHPRRLVWVLRPTAIYLLARLVALLAAMAAGALRPGVPLGTRLLVWDSRWYLAIARSGYPSVLPHAGTQVAMNPTAFLPLLPATIRAVADTTGLPLSLSGLLACSICGLIAAVVIWALCRDLWGEGAATRACALFCFFPGAIVLNFVYSEALLVPLAAGCLVALHRRRWVVAGGLAAMATATHAAGLALLAASAWAAAVAISRRREWPALVAPVLAPLGFLAFLGYLQVHTGSLGSYFLTNTQGFGERLSPTAPWTRVAALIANPGGQFAGVGGWPPNYSMETVNLVGLAFFILAAVVLIRARAPGTLVWYTGVVVGLNLFTTLGGLHPRFLLTAFPLVIVLGYWLRGVWYQVTLALFASGMVALLVATVATPAVIP